MASGLIVKPTKYIHFRTGIKIMIILLDLIEIQVLYSIKKTIGQLQKLETIPILDTNRIKTIQYLTYYQD